MTTYRCRTCGITWQMGPTRDMDPNEQCHCCAREGLGSTQARVAELEKLIVAYCDPDDTRPEDHAAVVDIHRRICGPNSQCCL